MGQARAMEQGKGVHGDSPKFTASNLHPVDAPLTGLAGGRTAESLKAESAETARSNARGRASKGCAEAGKGSSCPVARSM